MRQELIRVAYKAIDRIIADWLDNETLPDDALAVAAVDAILAKLEEKGVAIID